MALYLCYTMLKYLFYIFLAYMLYQVVFKLIIPIYRTTRQVKKSFRQMQEQMNAHANGPGYTNGQPYQSVNGQQTNNSTPKETKAGEYIDFEEIKD